MLIFRLVAEKIQGEKKKTQLILLYPNSKTNQFFTLELSWVVILFWKEVKFCFPAFFQLTNKRSSIIIIIIWHLDEKWCWNLRRSQDEIAREAIKHALKALRKRHLLEEGAHGPAFIALSRPIVSQVLSRFLPFKSYDFHLLNNIRRCKVEFLLDAEP